MFDNDSRPPANRKYRQKGFTLVELIVVLVIIGILLALVIPSLTGWIDRASTKSAMAECRLAVTAAQSLSLERYTAATPAEVTDAEVKALAKLPDSGTVSDMQIENATLQHLTYTNKYTITYCRNFASCADHDEMFNLEEAKKYPAWDNEKVYTKGDQVIIGKVIYEYNHPNNTSNHEPNGTLSNKKYWLVVGYIDNEPQSYNSSVLYAPGVVVVTKNGNKYERINYDLNGGQPPFSNSSSLYWTLIG